MRYMAIYHAEPGKAGFNFDRCKRQSKLPLHQGYRNLLTVQSKLNTAGVVFSKVISNFLHHDADKHQQI